MIEINKIGKKEAKELLEKYLRKTNGILPNHDVVIELDEESTEKEWHQYTFYALCKILYGT